MRIVTDVFKGEVEVVPLDSIYAENLPKVSPTFLRSVKNRGLTTFPTVRYRKPEEEKDIEESFLLVAGRRRIAALRELKVEQVPVVILEPDSTPEETVLLENLNRSRNLIVEAEAYEKLLKEGFDEESILKELGIFKRDVSRLQKLLKCSHLVRRKVCSGELSPSAAISLCRLPGAQQDEFFSLYDKWTLANAKEWVWRCRLNDEQTDFLNLELPSL